MDAEQDLTVTVVYPAVMRPNGRKALFDDFFFAAIVERLATVFEPKPTHLTESYRFQGELARDHARRFQFTVAMQLRHCSGPGVGDPYTVTYKYPYPQADGEQCKGISYDSISGIVGRSMEATKTETVITGGQRLSGASPWLDRCRSNGRQDGADAGRAWIEQSPEMPTVKAVCSAGPATIASVLAETGIAAPGNQFPWDEEGSSLYEVAWRDGFRQAVLEAVSTLSN